MKISNQNIQQNITPNKTASPKQDINLNALSVLMEKDSVSLADKKADLDIPEKQWHFQLAEPSMDNLLKGAGMPGKSSSNVQVSIIHTNDEHDPHFDKFAKETTLIKSRENFHGDENSLIVNTGDLTYESFNDKPNSQFFGPVAEIFEAQGVEYFVPGNHEFQHGGKWLEDNFLPDLKPEILLGNVTYKSGGKTIAHTKPYTIENVNGVNVGIIGLTTPKHKTKAHPNVGYDVKVESVRDAAARLVPEVKKAGADIVVIISHEAVGRVSDMASSVPGIDVVVAGHDHAILKDPKEIKNPDGRTTLVVEAQSHAKYVGDLTLDVDPKSKQVISADYKLYPTAGVKPDPEVMAILDRYNSNK